MVNLLLLIRASPAALQHFQTSSSSVLFVRFAANNPTALGFIRKTLTGYYLSRMSALPCRFYVEMTAKKDSKRVFLSSFNLGRNDLPPEEEKRERTQERKRKKNYGALIVKIT